MQLLHDHPTLVARGKESGLEVKEKEASNASLLMNPVASGDNVAMGLGNYKEELPPLVPCCEGKELRINENLVRSGLSAISVKHDNVIRCLSTSRACESIQILPGLVKHRNSYRCLHRPDLKRVPYLRKLTPNDLEMLFRGHSDFPSQTQSQWTDIQGNTSRAVMPPDGNIRNMDLRTKDAPPVEHAGPLHPIFENRSGAAEDVPAGMRLHCARARLYTSVLVGTTGGDQLDPDSEQEALDPRVPDDTVPDEEVQLHEELQIILPPRCDDVTTESSISSSGTSGR